MIRGAGPRGGDLKIKDKLAKRVEAENSLLCVGLDSNVGKLPERFAKLEHAQFEFNKWIIEQTHDLVCAYKPNSAFYEALGSKGWQELELTMEYLRSNYPEIVTILDAKRADIGSTNEGYVEAIFDKLGFDAVTLHPYLGREALEPFLEREDKASIILCRTSNSGAGELQDLVVGEKPVWQVVAEKVVNEWNERDNCMLVVGMTYPEEMAKIRGIVGEMDFLAPGAGAQGGEIEAAIKAGLNEERAGLIVNSARDVIFAEDPRGEAVKLRDEINLYR